LFLSLLSIADLKKLNL